MAGASAYQLPEGFTIPVRRSLTDTLAAALGLGLQLWLLGIIYYVCAHTLCVFFASRDPQFMEVLVRHITHQT